MELRAILLKFDILSITTLLKVESEKILLHICDTHNYDYLPHTTFRFYLVDFQLNADFPSQFYVFFFFFFFFFFTVKSLKEKPVGFSWQNYWLLLQLKTISGFSDNEA